MTSTEEGSLAPSQCVAVVELRSALPSLNSLYLLKDGTVTLCLTDFHFHRTVCKQKMFEEI